MRRGCLAGFAVVFLFTRPLPRGAHGPAHPARCWWEVFHFWETPTAFLPVGCLSTPDESGGYCWARPTAFGRWFDVGTLLNRLLVGRKYDENTSTFGNHFIACKAIPAIIPGFIRGCMQLMQDQPCRGCPFLVLSLDGKYQRSRDEQRETSPLQTRDKVKVFL